MTDLVVASVMLLQVRGAPGGAAAADPGAAAQQHGCALRQRSAAKRGRRRRAAPPRRQGPHTLRQAVRAAPAGHPDPGGG